MAAEEESRQLPWGQAFPAYREAVKRRLAPYNFTRPLQLRKDPRRQTKWTNWLEYLSYEQRRAEQYTARTESLEEQYRHAWRRLLEAWRCSSRKETVLNSASAPGGSTGSWATQTRQRWPGAKPVDLVKDLEAARADLGTTDKRIHDFIRETAQYRRAATAAFYQRLRVQWVVSEAPLMETGMSEQRGTARSSIKVGAKDDGRRRRADDEEEEEEDKFYRAIVQEGQTRRQREGYRFGRGTRQAAK